MRLHHGWMMSNVVLLHARLASEVSACQIAIPLFHYRCRGLGSRSNISRFLISHLFYKFELFITVSKMHTVQVYLRSVT